MAGPLLRTAVALLVGGLPHQLSHPSFSRTDLRIVPWGETPVGPGDFVWFSAYSLLGREVAITGLGYGPVEVHWQATATWPQCLFPDGAGAYVRGPRAVVVTDTESRVSNPRIALYKAAVILCAPPEGISLSAGAEHPHVKLVLGPAVARIPYVHPASQPACQIAVCSRVFGASVHVRFLREWFALHRSQGAGCFTLHDAGHAGRFGRARPDLAQVLAAQDAFDSSARAGSPPGAGAPTGLPAGRAASVEVVPLSGGLYRTWAYHQKLAYYDCLYRNHARAGWVLFLDVDETVFVRRGSLLSLLARLPAASSALVLQFAEVLTFVCHPDATLPLLERMTFVRTAGPSRLPRKNCIGGKYVVRPAQHVRTQLNTHSPFNRTRPACGMPGLTAARINHFHQLEHSGVVAEKSSAWVSARYCEEAGAKYAASDRPEWHSRYVNVRALNGSHPALAPQGQGPDVELRQRRIRFR